MPSINLDPRYHPLRRRSRLGIGGWLIIICGVVQLFCVVAFLVVTAEIDRRCKNGIGTKKVCEKHGFYNPQYGK